MTLSLEKYPGEPGVYLMKNQAGQVIYVGKAKNLKKRISQYFTPGRDERPIIPFLRKEIVTIETLVVFSDKEALLVENTLIKKYQPKYNACLKDDKTFISLMINNKHPWPMIRLMRFKGKPKEKGLYFGPYTSAYAARQTFELLTKLFPLRQCSDAELVRRKRPCILYSIKKCIAPCVNLCTKEEYDRFVEGAIKFLKGQDQEVVHQLYQDMEKASEKLEFERAASILETIRGLEHVTKTRQIVAKISGKNSDVLSLYRQGDETILMQIFFREGKLTGSEHYFFSQSIQQEEEILESFIVQFYRKPENKVDEIIIPFTLPHASLIEQILQEETSHTIKILVPKKGDKKKLLQICQKNAAATFKQKKDQEELREKMLLDLAETLSLNRYPRHIECFDISSISGTDIVGACVAFIDGEREKSLTRFYKIKGIFKSDDYGALHQVLSRRLTRAKEEENFPDLIILDGGRGQLNVAIDVLKELDIASVDAISIAKEEAMHTKGLTGEKIFTIDQKEPIFLAKTSPLLFLLQKIRDEAHRSALHFHQKQRKKRTIKSTLQTIPGIGEIKYKRLLQTFGSLKRITSASPEELKKVKGITNKDLENIKKLLGTDCL